MAREFNRAQRIAEQILREIAQLIQKGVKDPRLAMVTCTAVDVSRDLSYAKVFITIFNEEDESKINETLSVLNHASGFFRRELGKLLKLRFIPELRFVYDHSIRDGQRLQTLIDQAIAADTAKVKKDNDD